MMGFTGFVRQATEMVVVVSWISLHPKDLCYLIMTIIIIIIMKIIKG
uniref:Uncharacterized protein n=1 Tax=Brassica oleracea TaxID=3712 RepID=A0A3P6B0E3_BRAOL|nr:unnamed protein product [Brassica oleracea]